MAGPEPLHSRRMRQLRQALRIPHYYIEIENASKSKETISADWRLGGHGSQGGLVEVPTIGREGMLAMSGALNKEPSPSAAMVQAARNAWHRARRTLGG